MSRWTNTAYSIFAKAKQEFNAHVVDAPLEPVLHASGRRLVWLGIFATLAHLIFGYVWSNVFPQAFESGLIRLVLGSFGPVLIYLGLRHDLRSAPALVIAGLLFWFELPLFATYMYYMNGRNSMWLATSVAMILIYHNITDWRIASIGTLFAFLFGKIFAEITQRFLDAPIPVHGSDWRIDLMVVGFGWSVGAMLGLSAASRQKDLLAQTLVTIGIMAHELRTPLSSIGLISNNIENLTDTANDPLIKNRLIELSTKTKYLTEQMNRQIDMQIVNARQIALPDTQQRILASSLVQNAMQNYPFKSVKESNCWRINLERDFHFAGSHELMVQVIFNLVKNAVVSLKQANSDFSFDSIVVGVHADAKKGYITVTDKGIGINAAIQRTIFEPFFSTNQNTAHGLGLPFCKKVIGAYRGKLSVASQPGKGATFRIALPLSD